MEKLEVAEKEKKIPAILLRGAEVEVLVLLGWTVSEGDEVTIGAPCEAFEDPMLS